MTDDRGAEPEHYGDLDHVLETAWRLILRGVADRREPFHTPTIATVTPEGRPAVRTVVLRGASQADLRLRFHTDRRSSKLRDLAADPAIAVHFYDPRRKIQIRIDGTATVHHDDTQAREAWERSRPFSRACYRVDPAPGSVIAAPDALAPDAFAEPDAFKNFARVEIAVGSLEWLYLAVAGHRRARFDWRDGEATAVWLVP